MSFQSIEPFQSNIPTLIPSRYMIFCKSLHISGGLSGRRAQRAKSMPGSSSRRPREPLVSQFAVALSSPSSSAPTPKLHKRTNRPSNSRSLYLCIIVIKQCQMWGWRYVNLVAAVTPFNGSTIYDRWHSQPDTSEAGSPLVAHWRIYVRSDNHIPWQSTSWTQNVIICQTCFWPISLNFSTINYVLWNYSIG